MKLTSLQEVWNVLFGLLSCSECHSSCTSCLIDISLALVQELCSSKDAAATNEERLSAELATVSYS